MAIYDRNDNNSNLPMVRQPSQVQSREIGEIIIKSFETVTEALSGGDVPVNSKQIEDAVVKGINRSKVVAGTGNGSGTPFNPENDYYNKLQQAKYEDYLKRREQREKEEAQREIADRQRKINENIDKTFNEINKWSNNPLKGASDALDNGIKKLLGKRDENDPSTKAIVESNDKEGNLITNSIIEVGSSVAAVGKFLNEWKEQQQKSQEINHVDMDSLIEEEKDSAEQQKEDNDEAEKDRTKESALNMVKIGLIVAGVSGIALSIPILVSSVADFFATFPLKIDKLEGTLEGYISGPYSIGKEITAGIRSAFGMGTLTKDEKDELKTLNSRKEDYNKFSSKITDPDSKTNWSDVKSSLATKLGLEQENMNAESVKEAYAKLSDSKKLKLTGKEKDYLNYYLNELSEEESVRLSQLQDLKTATSTDFQKGRQEQIQQNIVSKMNATINSGEDSDRYLYEQARKQGYNVEMTQNVSRTPTKMESLAMRDDDYRQSWSNLGGVFKFYVTGEASKSPFMK